MNEFDKKKMASIGEKLSGGGETGRLVRGVNWSRTQLGPWEAWPQSLRTTVDLCLASNFPIAIAWGPDGVLIYNDGYVPICGGKHPRAMGQNFRECWAEAWGVIGDAYESALVGETSFLENQRIFLDRNGFLEETFFSFSFSPIRDESGGIGGLFHPVVEMTGKILSERRTRVLKDVADRTAKSKTIDEACTLTVQTLADHATDVPFALLYLFEDGGTSARLVGLTGLQEDAQAYAISMDKELWVSATWPLGAVFLSGSALELDHLDSRFEHLRSGPYPESPKGAILLPITPPGAERAVGVLVAGVSARLALDEVYRGFYDLLAAAVTTAIANGRAFEQERRRAEALAEIDRAKTAFFSNVSHEFRTPLTLMLGPMEDILGRQHSTLNDEDRTELEIVHRNGRRLLKLVNSLLDFSRIEAGRLQANYEQTDLSSLTKDLASGFRSLIERAGMELELNCSALTTAAYVDRDMWEKIVLNLLSNAFKYTFEGKITVMLQQVGDQLEFTVTDTGTGIAEGELVHIFERFHRVEGASGRTHEGTGIGLAFVQELVKLHGGTVTVKSLYGQGSTFSVRMPLGKAHLPEARIGKDRNLASNALGAAPFVDEALRWVPGGEGSGPRERPSLLAIPALSGGSGGANPGARILLADDNTDMRHYVCKLLEAEGWRVMAVNDGEAALARALSDRPDLILTDVMMPRLDGFGLLSALKENERTRAIPVIMLSARAGSESKVEGMKAGADDYLVKPFSAKELVTRVNTHLQIGKLRAEAILEREKLFSVFMQAPAPICVLEGPEHLITLANPAYIGLLFGRRELVGKTIRKALPEIEFQGFPELLDEVYRTGRPFHGIETPVQLLQDDGQMKDFFLNFVYQPTINVRGETEGIVVVVHDVTLQLEARTRIRESEKKFRNLADSMPQLIWTADGSGTIDYTNRGFADFSGLIKPEIFKGPDSLLVHPEDYQGLIEKWGTARARGQIFQGEARFRRHDGVYRWFLLRAVPSKSEVSGTEKWFGSCTDMEEQKQLTMELAVSKSLAESANAAKSRFLANMSHEIRTPLGIILGFSEFLLEPLQSAADRHDCTITIRRNATQLSSLINELLDISKIEADRLEIEKIRFELRDLIRDVQQLMGFHAKEKGVGLNFYFDGPVQKNITTDPVRLRQILINIVGNALKFTEKGGVAVHISMSPSQGELPSLRLRFDVFDTGIGLSPEQTDRIWEPFVQADSSTTRRFGGSGLGLPLSRRLAIALGGDLFLSKSNPGLGSHFTFTIDAGPLESLAFSEARDLADSQIGAETMPTPAREGLKGATVLIVDDSPDNQLLIKRILMREGASVDLADNGAEGVAKALAGDYHIVLMDVQMPILDGYEAVTKLREQGYQKPVIALTAHAMKGEREKSIAHGFTDHLSKPIDRKLIIEKLISYFQT